MGVSILIAKILSVVYLSLGLEVLLNRDYYKIELVKMMDNSSFLCVGGFMAVVFGFTLIELDNTWGADWTTIITIVVWVALMKGIVLLAFPNIALFYKRTVFQSDNFTMILLPALFLLGLVFGYFEFIHS